MFTAVWIFTALVEVTIALVKVTFKLIVATIYLIVYVTVAMLAAVERAWLKRQAKKRESSK